MALGPLISLDNAKRARTGFDRLETEILAETAANLGHHGRMAEKALEKLAAATDDDREALLQEAADAVWSYFIQREFCGMRDQTAIIREMNIPRPVLNRMGAIKKKWRSSRQGRLLLLRICQVSEQRQPGLKQEAGCK